MHVLCNIAHIGQYGAKRTMAGRTKIRAYARGDRVYVQAQRIWLILSGFVSSPLRKAGDRETITYGELAERMGYVPRAGHTLGRQLGIVGKCCLENGLPALNSIVVTALEGAPGDEVVLKPGRKIKQEQRAVHQQDWYQVGVPSTGMLRRVWEGM
jgi:hypothetical protein